MQWMSALRRWPTRIALALCGVVWAFGALRAPVIAGTPYNTWAGGPGGYLVMTQDAYRPLAEITLDVDGPEDLFIAPDGLMYIADTGNGRIVKLDDFAVVATYGEDVLESPTGVFVDADGKMTIADAGTDTIVILDGSGRLVTQFGRPSEPLFGKDREFLPRKVAVDARRNLYVISEGSVNGVVQLNAAGNFIGYFGANSSAMSLKMILQRLFLTEEQLDQFVKNEAASPSNLVIDHQSLLYTVTEGTSYTESIRKYTVSGKNIFPTTWGSTTFRDIHVDPVGLVVAVDQSGAIAEYDQNGRLLFVFGSGDEGGERLGTLTDPVAIDGAGERLYVLDKERNAVVVYETTAFAKKVHEGVRRYIEGYYAEAKPFFEEVLDFNGSFILSYQAIADAYFKAGDYPQALTAYRYAEDRRGYSQAFWELRNVVLQRTLTQALGGLAGLWVVTVVAGRLDRRQGWSKPWRERLRALQRFRLVDDFVFLFRFIKQPVDSFYYIKTGERGSLRFALLLYTWVLALRVLVVYATSFVFSPYSTLAYFRIEDEIVPALLIIALWNAANYLVSTISDGEGRVRDVIIGSAYSLFPYALFGLPIALVSNLLTQNEVFVFTFSTNLMWGWVGIMLFIMVKEIHNYTFSETIRNVLTTLFTMALFLLTGYILYVLFNQLYEFVYAIVQEVGLRV
ncbi:MAG TPA: hypothetical protein PK954_21010 [Anaerolineales bacterium]|nr:hypothetical protein [Anaerolineales bacterium]HRF46355.1 hypothetical protein [Anaerolineales bacterium]